MRSQNWRDRERFHSWASSTLTRGKGSPLPAAACGAGWALAVGAVRRPGCRVGLLGQLTPDLGGQVAQRQGLVVLLVHERVPYQVLELADVPGEGDSREGLDEGRPHGRRPGRIERPVLLQEVVDDGPDVGRPLAEGRDVDRQNVEPVEEVLTEQASLTIARRSRLVAAMIRTLTGTSRSSPTARTRLSCTTRSSFAWSGPGSSPISSRKRTPPSAARIRPARSCARRCTRPGASRRARSPRRPD